MQAHSESTIKQQFPLLVQPPDQISNKVSMLQQMVLTISLHLFHSPKMTALFPQAKCCYTVMHKIIYSIDSLYEPIFSINFCFALITSWKWHLLQVLLPHVHILYYIPTTSDNVHTGNKVGWVELNQQMNHGTAVLCCLIFHTMLCLDVNMDKSTVQKISNIQSNPGRWYTFSCQNLRY